MRMSSRAAGSIQSGVHDSVRASSTPSDKQIRQDFMQTRKRLKTFQSEVKYGTGTAEEKESLFIPKSQTQVEIKEGQCTRQCDCFSELVGFPHRISLLRTLPSRSHLRIYLHPIELLCLSLIRLSLMCSQGSIPHALPELSPPWPDFKTQRFHRRHGEAFFIRRVLFRRQRPTERCVFHQIETAYNSDTH